MSNSTSDRSLLPGLALAAAGSIALSGKAIIVKLAYRYDVDPVTLLMFRMLFALPIFVLMAWWSEPSARSTDGSRLVWHCGAGNHRVLPGEFPGLRRPAVRQLPRSNG